MRKKSFALALCAAAVALLALNSLGCGGSSLASYREKALEIHGGTADQLSSIFEVFTETDFQEDPEGSMALLERALGEGKDVASDSYAELVALEVPREAESVQAELLDFYRRLEERFDELEKGAASLDLEDPMAIMDFVEKLETLQDLGDEGSELSEKIGKL